MLAKLTGFTSGWFGGDELKARKSLLQRVPSGVAQTLMPELDSGRGGDGGGEGLRR